MPEFDNTLTLSSCGIDFLSDFWRKKYLREYIRDGGSKIKFVTDRSGSGKTHFLRLMNSLAKEDHYKTVHFPPKTSGCMISGKFMWKS